MKKRVIIFSGAKIRGFKKKTINISSRPFNRFVRNFEYYDFMKMSRYVKLIVTKKRGGQKNCQTKIN